MTRTNVDIDDEACEQIMRQHRLRTKREAVNLALRNLAASSQGSAGNPVRESRVERLRSVTQMSADEVIDLGIDLVERQVVERSRFQAATLLSSAFVGCLPEAPNDLAANHRRHLAESFGNERDAD